MLCTGHFLWMMRHRADNATQNWNISAAAVRRPSALAAVGRARGKYEQENRRQAGDDTSET
jgi:hypothetical protein